MIARMHNKWPQFHGAHVVSHTCTGMQLCILHYETDKNSDLSALVFISGGDYILLGVLLRHTPFEFPERKKLLISRQKGGRKKSLQKKQKRRTHRVINNDSGNNGGRQREQAGPKGSRSKRRAQRDIRVS